MKTKLLKYASLCKEVYGNNMKGLYLSIENVTCVLQHNEEKEELIIIFRGTDDIKDFISDIRFDKKKLGLFDMKAVHYGFQEMYKKIFSKIGEYILPYMKLMSKEKIKHIILIGHSMGGALATICAFSLYNYQKKLTEILNKQINKEFKFFDIEVYTFGSPRVFNIPLTKYYNKLIPNTYRIKNGNDIVSILPYFFLFYKHVGKRIRIGKYRHWKFWGDLSDHMIGNYIKNIPNMKLPICPNHVAPDCECKPEWKENYKCPFEDAINSRINKLGD